jgi:hypothetical protein
MSFPPTSGLIHDKDDDENGERMTGQTACGHSPGVAMSYILFSYSYDSSQPMRNSLHRSKRLSRSILSCHYFTIRRHVKVVTYPERLKSIQLN